MNLRDLIEALQALQPPSALDANVSVAVGEDDYEVMEVRYSHGRVTILVDAPEQIGYDEGYDDGFKAGKEEAGD